MSHMVQNIDIKCPSGGPIILISSHGDCPTVTIKRVFDLSDFVTTLVLVPWKSQNPIRPVTCNCETWVYASETIANVTSRILSLSIHIN